MSRPTKEQVDAALEAVEPWEWTDSSESILGREVRALRAERPDMTTQQIADAITREVIAQMREEAAQLRATIARIEALPAKWLAKRGVDTGTLTNAELALIGFTFRDCADELEAALKGGV